MQPSRLQNDEIKSTGLTTIQPTSAMAAYRSVSLLRRVGSRQLSRVRAQSTLVSDLAPMPAVAKDLFLGHLDQRVLSYPDVISTNPIRLHELNARCR